MSEINVFNRHTALGACGTFGEMVCIRYADMFLYFVWVHFIVWGGGQGLQPPSIYVLNFPPSLSSLHILLLRHHFTLKMFIFNAVLVVQCAKYVGNAREGVPVLLRIVTQDRFLCSCSSDAVGPGGNQYI